MSKISNPHINPTIINNQSNALQHQIPQITPENLTIILNPQHPHTLSQYFNAFNIRILGTDEDPLFLMSDIAKHLNDTHCDRLTKTYTSGYLVKMKHPQFPKHPQGVNFFTEKGLYKYLLRSNSPKAEEFQDFVFDILKQTRHQIVDSHLLKLKIADENNYAYEHHLSYVDNSRFNDRMLEAEPISLAKFYITKYITISRRDKSKAPPKIPFTYNNISEDVLCECFDEADDYFGHDQNEFEQVIWKILNKFFYQS